MTGTTSLLGGCWAVVQAPGGYVKLASLIGIMRHAKRIAIKRHHNFDREYIRWLMRERTKGDARVY